MKKIALMTLTSLFLAAASMTASANEEASAGFGADMASGFIAWKKDQLRYGGENGKMIAHEVDAWLQTLKRVQAVKKK